MTHLLLSNPGTTIECAKLEAGSFLGNAELYKITPKQPQELWNLENVLQALSDPCLLDLVKKVPTSKRWILQKTPLFSQLISCLLRSIGGNGLIFPSTKLPAENIIAFFLKDDQQSQSFFKAERIQIKG